MMCYRFDFSSIGVLLGNAAALPRFLGINIDTRLANGELSSRRFVSELNDRLRISVLLIFSSSSTLVIAAIYLSGLNTRRLLHFSISMPLGVRHFADGTISPRLGRLISFSQLQSHSFSSAKNLTETYEISISNSTVTRVIYSAVLLIIVFRLQCCIRHLTICFGHVNSAV